MSEQNELQGVLEELAALRQEVVRLKTGPAVSTTPTVPTNRRRWLRQIGLGTLAAATGASVLSTETQAQSLAAPVTTSPSGATMACVGLEIKNGGPFRITGAGYNSTTSAYIHTAFGSNILGSFTILDHPLLNGNSSAIVLVTPSAGLIASGSVTNGYQPIALAYFDAATPPYPAKRWVIFNTNSNNMVSGTYYNILIIQS